MIDTAKLRGVIIECGLTQQKVAEAIGISARTFYSKMKNGVFNSGEIDAMISLLHIDDPVRIFFANDVAHKATSDLQCHLHTNNQS